MEEPSSDFLKLRDYVDALDCRNLSAFSPENLRSGFSDKMVQQARDELKINKVKNDVETKVVILLKCRGLLFFFICMIHILPSPLVTDSKYLIANEPSERRRSDGEAAAE